MTCKKCEERRKKIKKWADLALQRTKKLLSNKRDIDNTQVDTDSKEETPQINDTDNNTETLPLSYHYIRINDTDTDTDNTTDTDK